MDYTTLEQAKQWLRDRLDEGADCPCCGQRAQMYKRKIHKSMASGLIRFWRSVGEEWGYVPDVLPSDRLSADFPKLRYWELIEEEPGVRDDGSTRIGSWRVLPSGVAFIERRMTVRKYAKVYNGRAYGLVGDPVDIVDALGDKFVYRDLMAGR